MLGNHAGLRVWGINAGLKGMDSRVKDWIRIENATDVMCGECVSVRGQRARGKPSGGGYACGECHRSRRAVSLIYAIRVESGDGR